ncbi:hypothetical protein HD593_003367 [Nonomuraea rubra]|uniref:Uncharacterized protein n=1 Tax=Nonomuraea rubra TaxID=46180 RepID=A0A7X0NS74_9ACTN|nr:hypothetical protein [Nonomuraea rubra]
MSFTITDGRIAVLDQFTAPRRATTPGAAP